VKPVWVVLAVAGVCGPGGYYAASATLDMAAQRIPLTATRFEFSAKEISVKKGRPVTLVLTTPDFVHGFSVPDFNVRVDLSPGRTVEVTFTPDRAGRFVFLCDNFCGEGHDRMTGFLVVTENQAGIRPGR
jgi:cytochrome c oxidase subunit II